METRKVQLAGGTTYTVSLPKEWATEHGLEPGRRVHLYPHTDGSLVVRTNGHTATDDERVTIPAENRSPAALRRTLGAAYRTGSDVVEVTASDLTDAQRRAVRETAQRLLGVDVVEQTDSRVVCKSLLDAGDVSIDQTLRQLQFAVCSSTRDAVAALLEDGDPQRVEDRRAEATRLVALLTRQFERTLFEPGDLDDVADSRATVSDYDAAARQLQRVATHATTLASVARRRDDPVPADVTPAIDSTANEACDLVERATGTLLDGGDVADACTLLAQRDELVETALDRAVADETPAALAVAYHALAGTAECGGAVADVALRAATRRDDS